MGIVGDAASSARAGFMARPIAPPAAMAEPMNSRRDKSSLSLAMCSPEKEQPNGGMAATKVPSAQQIRARQADHVVMRMVYLLAPHGARQQGTGPNGNTAGARHGSLRPQ